MPRKKCIDQVIFDAQSVIKLRVAQKQNMVLQFFLPHTFKAHASPYADTYG